MDYVRFGHGKDVFVILPGISIGSVTAVGESVSVSYSCFCDDFTVYLFDRKRDMQPGYTVCDMAHDTAEAMHTLGISDACIFGASQGGMMAMVLAAEYPSLVRKIVVGSSAAKATPTAEATISLLLETAENGSVRELKHMMNEQLFTEAYRTKFAFAFEAAEGVGTPEDIERFIIMANAVKGFDVTPALPSITCPMLVIGAGNDTVVGCDASREIAETAGCELFVYEDYCHAVYDEAADYKERLLSFFKK